MELDQEGWFRSTPAFLGPENPAEVVAPVQVPCVGMLPIPGAVGGKRGWVLMHMARM